MFAKPLRAFPSLVRFEDLLARHHEEVFFGPSVAGDTSAHKGLLRSPLTIFDRPE